jgi:hypothetical protein
MLLVRVSYHTQQTSNNDPLILSAARRRPGQHRCGATGRGPGGYCGEDPAVVALHGHHGGGGLLDQGSGLRQG